MIDEPNLLKELFLKSTLSKLKIIKRGKLWGLIFRGKGPYIPQQSLEPLKSSYYQRMCHDVEGCQISLSEMTSLDIRCHLMTENDI